LAPTATDDNNDSETTNTVHTDGAQPQPTAAVDNAEAVATPVDGDGGPAATAAAPAAAVGPGENAAETVPENPPAAPAVVTAPQVAAQGEAEAVLVETVTEEGADSPEYVATEADRRLDSVYGDHPHQNDGRHLNGGVADDPFWQARWKRVAGLPQSHYSVPSGRVGRRFLAMLTREFKGVRQREWNSERPLIFPMVILQKTEGTTRAQDIRKRLTQRMDLWDKGKYAALVDDTEDELLSRVGSGTRIKDDDASARQFNATVLSGRLRKAVRGLTNRDGGGILQPDDACTKTGRPVLEVLRDKHPAMRDPDLTGPNPDTFEHYDSTPDAVPLNITAKDVEEIASKLSGAAGPSGVDAVDLRNWLLRFGAESEALREELAQLTNILSNENPSWASYRALMACRLVALDKQPGVRPVGIGEIYRRLMAKCVLAATGHRATDVCGNLNLCAGLPAGIEGAVHAMTTEWEKATAEPTEAADPPVLPAQPQPGEAANDDETPMEPEEPEDVHITLMVDAANGFNELGRKAMLWTVRHRWAPGARFTFNCYRHASMLILRRPGKPCHIILSNEGVTQGCPLSMILFGLGVLPIAEKMRQAEPSVVQAWFADDSAMSGPAKRVAAAYALLELIGPARGYFPEPAKSIVVCQESKMDQARRTLERFQFQYCDGHRYVGGFIGSAAARARWLAPKILDWVYGVNQLAKVASRYPQTAYAGLAKSLQSEWQYLQRVLPDSGDAFAPVEEAIANAFLPALLQEQAGLPERLRNLLALPVRQAGIGIPSPGSTAAGSYAASFDCTRLLAQSLRDGTDLDVVAYRAGIRAGRLDSSKTRTMVAEAALTSLLADATPAATRQATRAKSTGAWITAMPDALNGTVLSSDEFRDSLRLRYGLRPTNLPITCDGCTKSFSVEHAMSCKVGGLVLLRHNDVSGEWHRLCAQALTPAAVTDEPLIHSGRELQVRANGEGQEAVPETRGDVAAHGFWKRGATTIFDVRITDTDAPSYRNRDPVKVLAVQEKEKKDKYLENCLARRRHFTPLVFSVDGLRGVEATAASNRLAAMLSAKWHRSYSEVCGYVRSRLAISLARTTSLCLRGARDPTARASHPTWDNGAGLGLYRS
jgi:hypothetical protein